MATTTTTQELPPPIALFRLATGFYVSSALYVAAKLGIADLCLKGRRHLLNLQRQRACTRVRCIALCGCLLAPACSPKTRRANSL